MDTLEQAIRDALQEPPPEAGMDDVPAILAAVIRERFEFRAKCLPVQPAPAAPGGTVGFSRVSPFRSASQACPQVFFTRSEELRFLA
jgi:hypothetical protein